MAEIITMPRLSDTMTEGVVSKWLKKVGDSVKEGDILAEIETDKATMEFESFHNGKLLFIGIKEGQTAPVDSVIAIIGAEGENIQSLLDAHKGGKQEEVKPAASAVEAQAKEVPARVDVSVPKDVQVITMPRLSDTMSEGTVAKWLKKVGDTVKEGEILAEIESDKATMEFESFHQGTLLYVGVQEGGSAKVDSILAVIGNPGTDIKALVESFGTKGETKAVSEVKTPEQAPQKLQTTAENKIPEYAPVITEAPAGGKIVASPLARKLAAERNIDLQTVSGTGEGGRIIKRDIENYVAGSSVIKGKPFVPKGQERFEEIPNSQMRKVIARRLAESKFTAPHYYLNMEFDMDNAISFRNQYNSLPDTKISFNDIIIKATALALKKHPRVNSQWFDDRMRINHHVHIGVAVAVEDGLLVPVLRFADEQSLTQIGDQVKEYAGKARNKKLAPNEMEGSTFTISNLGMFGISEFTSIINQPNSAILSVGAILEKPVVKNGNIVAGNTMKLTLACDHRTVDGATGALFLQTLKAYIENPVTMLV
ncbi:MAG: 2-oxo acid dehydrogenase subunit E2 [Flavobacteriaceae bacterium]|nr:2-oxo acid dehydrogenase subunit E2 [Flavobacteriaceae bacterium]